MQTLMGTIWFVGLTVAFGSSMAGCIQSPPATRGAEDNRESVAWRTVRHPLSGIEVPCIALPQRPAVEQAVHQELDSLAAHLRCEPEDGGEFDANVRVTHAANEVFSVSIRASIWCNGLSLVADGGILERVARSAR